MRPGKGGTMSTRSGPGDGRPDPGLSAIMSEQGQLVNLAYRLLGSLAEAEDAVQETKIRRRAAHQLLIRRSSVTPDLAFYLGCAPGGTTPADLVRITGASGRRRNAAGPPRTRSPSTATAAPTRSPD